jgi:hypothetical protein
MRAWAWLAVAAAGWGVMLAAYATRAKPGPADTAAYGLIAIGPELPAEIAQTGRATRVNLRSLPAIERTEAILKAMSQVAKDKATDLEFELRPKLILMPLSDAGINASSLQSGRMPEAGRDEVLVGPSAAHQDRITVGDRALDVVGVLKPGCVLFKQDYLIPPSDTKAALFPAGDPSVHVATLLQLTAEQFHNQKLLQQLMKSLPPPAYTVVMPVERLEPVVSYLYTGGLAAFLLGGSGAIIGLFRGLAAKARLALVAADDGQLDELSTSPATKARPSWWAVPLLEMDQRPRLVWGVHLTYFGLVIIGSVLVASLPDVQAILLSNVRGALGASSGPLAAAAKAYESGNVARAAAVTFVINFFLGSLLVITLPSMLVPGSGVLMAALRSMVWGFLLAPTVTVLAYTMLPHSGTMLLEGEGYILAALFGLLIPVHIFQSSLGGTPLSRLARALWLNFQANFWVAVVLAVAACYEATEVIWMNR